MAAHSIHGTFSYSLQAPVYESQPWQNCPTDSSVSHRSSNTVHHNYDRKPSLSSKGSLGCAVSGPLRVANENLSPSRTTSLPTLHFVEAPVRPSSLKNVPKAATRQPSWDRGAHALRRARDGPDSISEAGPLEDVDLNGRCDETGGKYNSSSDLEYSNHGLSFEIEKEDTISTKKPAPTDVRENILSSPSIIVTDATSHPIKRLLSTLHHRYSNHKRSLSVRKERWSLDDFDENLPAVDFHAQQIKSSGHKKTSSWASSGFVAAVKSATGNLGALSASPSQATHRFAPLRNSKRSSKLSQVTNQGSVNGNHESRLMVDEAAWDRAIQRRRTLEELISSEESYIADLKVLKNVYFTLLASAPNVSTRTSDQIFRNVEDILSLHEELLLHIRFVVSDPELRSDSLKLPTKRSSKYAHFTSREDSRATPGGQSVDVVRHSADMFRFGRFQRGILLSEPSEVAEVAKTFGRFMVRFFVYEEYGAQYELMLRDLTSTSRTIPNWHAYERGIEALANSLSPTNTQGEVCRKGLTFEDLLIKPIQRICKYPLLFDDLYKYTPVIDGPDSRAEVEKVLCRLRETTQEINKATNDPQAQARIQRSWRLQDLLIIPDAPAAPSSLRLMGHADLCGVLYVAYQTIHGLRGDYMLSMLFKSYLLLALPKSGTRYEIVAIIGLGDARVDTPDNGRGLQCHNALHTWKLIFESDQRLYELVLCACSLREEEQWKTGLLHNSAKEAQRQFEDQSASSPLYSVLCLDLKSLGNVFGPPGTLIRRISIQRAATISPRSSVSQVIIKNTAALKNQSDINNAASASMGRSQSLLSTNRVPILAPKRADRLRMECALADVWTRDLLPFPGMSANRSEHLIRSSANSVMRKLSRASLASNFTKRSTSLATLADDESGYTEVQSGNEEKSSFGFDLTTHQSMASLMSLKSEDGAPVAPTRIEPTRRATIEEEMISIHNDFRTRKPNKPEPSVKSEAIIKTPTKLAKSLRGKRSRPDVLLKAFSGWFKRIDREDGASG